MSLERTEPSYFGAGPAVLPTSVLQQAALDLINYENQGLGVGEISHRSASATKVIDDTKQYFKELYSIPDTHEVFFMQGGGTTGFSSIATNMMAHHVKKTGSVAKGAYIITGSWSQKSEEEARRLGLETEVLFHGKKEFGSFTKIGEISKPKDAAYVYYCENETVHGVEFPETPEFDVPIVADLSSDILSRKIDVSKYGVIMAGAQKNVGLAGLTIYIVRKDLLDQADDETLKKLGVPLSPIAFHWPTVAKNNSAYNTIPIFTLHILKLVLHKLIQDGGIEQVQQVNERKAKKLYAALDAYPEIFNLPVDKSVRSKMNIVWTLKQDREAEFLKGAQEKNLTGLKGHRSVGGFRASLYNAVSEDAVDKLVEYVHEFAKA